LRNAYPADYLAAPATELRQAPREELSLSLKETSEAQDTVPDFSREQTPLSMEAQLLSLAAALRREEVQYAVIGATDPLDTFFLARFLSTHSPNIRLLQFDADLLFVRPPESLPLVGMLSVTTYPLMVQNQVWTGSPGATVFSRRYAEGVFNAVISLLEPDGRHILDYNSPWPDDGRGPPLWVTAAGRDGYWPVSLLPAGRDPTNILFERPPRTKDEGTPTTSSDPGRADRAVDPRVEDPSHLFLVLEVLLASVGAYLAVALFWPRRAAAWVSDFNVGMGPTSRRRGVYMLVCILSAAAMYLSLAGVYWRLFPKEPGWEGLAAGGALLFIAPAFYVTYLSARPVSGLLCPLAVWAGFGAFIFTGFLLLTSTEYHQGFFLAYRALHLTSGLAPNLPLLLALAAFALWGWVHWQRLVLLEERRQWLPQLSGPGYGAKLAAAEAGLKESLGGACMGHPWLSGLTGLGVGLVAFWVGQPHLGTLEPWPYELLYSGMLAILCSLLLVTVCQFLVVWTHLEGLLDQIELHPIRFALSELPPDRSWSPLWQSSVRKRSHLLLARSVDCLRALVRHRADLGDHLKNLQNEVDSVVADVAERRSESDDQVKATKRSVDIAAHLAGELQTTHWREGASETFQEAVRREATAPVARPTLGEWAKEKPHRLSSEFVALRFLAYIRYVMLHLRNLLGFVTTGFILAVLSLDSYPFQSPEIIGTLNLTLFVLLGGVVGWVFYRMNRNAVLRRISSREEGKSDWSFVVRLVETGALPLLALISTRVPGVGRFLFSWLQPALERLH
jgi:hypothetical protein